MNLSDAPMPTEPQPPRTPAPVDEALFLRLAAKLGLAVPPGEVATAFRKAGATAQAAADGDAPTAAAEHLRRVLASTSVRGAQVAQLGWRRFDLRRLPALVWHAGGWSLAERSDPVTVLLTDATGVERSAPLDEMQDATVLWLRPSARRPAGAGPLGGNLAARLVWRELFRDAGWLGQVTVATLIINLLALTTSLFGMQVYDRVVPTLAYATLTTLVAGMGLVIALDWILKTTRSRILDSLACQVDKRVSQQVFDHLLHIRLDLQPKSLGTLAAQVNGLDAVRQFFSAGIVFGLVDMPFALLFIAAIGVVGGPVAWVYAGVFPLALALGWATQWRLGRLLRQQMMRSNERQGLLVDAIRGAESIRASNAAWRFSGEWQAITATIDSYGIRQKAITQFAMVTTGSLSSIAYVGAIVVGVWEIESGHLSMGALIACGMLGGRVIAPLAQGVQYVIQWQQVRQALRLVDGVLQLEPERAGGQLLMPEAPPMSTGVEGVRYAYPESPLQQLDIDRLGFRAGERVLLVGPVGCGKSTLLKVLAGLYRPNEGRVRLGDADLWSIDPQVVASQVGYLPQAVHLFKGTLRSNLALAGAGGDAHLARIARELGIDAIAAGSPLGMELPIGEGGDGLSGGQRQLVALARVATAQPRIWLLDEPTASLDAEGERRVWQVLAHHVRPDDILIVATHRPMQAAQVATRVVVLREGRVVSDGSPEAIMPTLWARAGHGGPPPRKPTAAPRAPALAIMGDLHVV